MSEDAVPVAPVAPIDACANCGIALHGPFCAACGQPVKPLDPPVRHFIGEFAQEFFDIDGRLLRSFRRVLFAPGFLTREHVEGRRAPWLSPLKLYLLASVAMFGAQALGGIGDMRLTTTGDAEAVAQYLRDRGFADIGELQRTIETARLTWMPRVMFVLVPLFACLIAVVERRARRRYPSHLVFALHVHAAGFIARAVAAALAFPLPAWREPFIQTASLYAVIYLFLAFRRAYGDSRSRAVFDTAVVAVIYVLVLVVATIVVVGLAMFGPSWPGTWTT